MPSKKTATTTTADDAAVAAQADQPVDAPLPMPTTGGSWIRQPDGSLVRDPAEHPEAAGDVPQV